jgi:hypothetical protein
VWADEQLQQQLLGLPFTAILQLLQHAARGWPAKTQ